jgi:CheY-like chemotaxis protein
MDCSMPVMDGLQATREIRRSESERGAPPCPIVAMTANALRGDREECLAAGMDDYLSKPYSADQLAELLQRWLPQRGEGADAVAAEPPPARAPAAAPTPETAGQDLDAALDPSVLGGIRGMDPDGSQGFLRRVVESYLTNSVADIEALESSGRAGDAESLRKCAHRLKSASANVGARGLATQCQTLESLARAGDLGSARGALDALRSEYARVRAALEQASRNAA